jgi:hypothetical protein
VRFGYIYRRIIEQGVWGRGSRESVGRVGARGRPPINKYRRII